MKVWRDPPAGLVLDFREEQPADAPPSPDGAVSKVPGRLDHERILPELTPVGAFGTDPGPFFTRGRKQRFSSRASM
jgi:hypothetical protein